MASTIQPPWFFMLARRLPPCTARWIDVLPGVASLWRVEFTSFFTSSWHRKAGNFVLYRLLYLLSGSFWHDISAQLSQHLLHRVSFLLLISIDFNLLLCNPGLLCSASRKPPQWSLGTLDCVHNQLLYVTVCLQKWIASVSTFSHVSSLLYTPSDIDKSRLTEGRWSILTTCSRDFVALRCVWAIHPELKHDVKPWCSAAQQMDQLTFHKAQIGSGTEGSCSLHLLIMFSPAVQTVQ